MSRSRKWGEDLTYSEEHRAALPELYGRIGHRIDMADRDWTEFCHYCKEPLALFEEVRDRGQDLLDKATTVTRRVATRAGLPAYLLAWRTDRTAAVQREIEALYQRQRELEAAHRITGFTTRRLAPVYERSLQRLTPTEWWEWLLVLHRHHHAECPKKPPAVKVERLYATLHEHPLHNGKLWEVA